MPSFGGETWWRRYPRAAFTTGGRARGAVLVSVLSKSHARGDPFFTLTQNALADGTYLQYLRLMYGKQIAVRRQIRAYVQANVNGDEEVELQDGDNIFRLGYVSSLFATRLLAFVEKAGSVAVADDDIALPNFSSVDAMVKLVVKYRNGASP